VLPATLMAAPAPEYVAVIDNFAISGIETPIVGVDLVSLGYESPPRTVPGTRKDLNNDGTPDLILRGSLTYCGTGGCALHVFDGKSGRKIGNLFGNPLLVHATVINGWPVLSIYSHGSATSGSYRTFVFDGRQYVQASSVMLYEESVIELFGRLPPAKPPDDAWGDPVDGVQLRLALATGMPPTPPGELPVFELQIRNQGSSAVTVNPDMLCPDIEIDGVWYTQICVNTGSSRPVDIAPGSWSDALRIRPNPAHVMFEMQGKPAPRAGPHGVRVRNPAVYTVRADRTAGFVQVWLKLVSNRITIDIPASTAAQAGQ
jgi:hypothetical protein